MLPGELLQREQEFYNRRWKRPEVSASERERAALSVAAVPRPCRSLLDVGCGDGRLTQRLREELGCLIVGVDLSTTALSNLPDPKCCGSADRLPFPDRSFGVVVATEILEHVPEVLYLDVIRELARVADTYILVTVPCCENLDENTAICGVCGARFHPWGHLRSYTPLTMKDLFVGFKRIRVVPFGEPEGLYNRFLLWLRQRVAGAWYWETDTACYFCQATSPPSPRWPFLARVCDALNARFWASLFTRPRWLLCLYARAEQ
jgi:SAM-dependent methyltransferase